MKILIPIPLDFDEDDYLEEDDPVVEIDTDTTNNTPPDF